MRRYFRSIQWVLLLAAAACQTQDAGQVCQAIGACDPPAAEAETVLILCDVTPGSVCDASTVDSTVTLAVRHLQERPGSSIEIWALKSDVGATQEIARFTITASSRAGQQAIRAHHVSQEEDARLRVARQIAPYLEATPPNRSPLIGFFGKASLTRSDNNRLLHLVLISDAMPFGEDWSWGSDWECNQPQDTLQLNDAVKESGVLVAESLQNTVVTFSFMTLGEIDGGRCRREIGAARRIRALWTSLLMSVGAQQVTFVAGPPDFDAAHTIDSGEPS